MIDKETMSAIARVQRAHDKLSPVIKSMGAEFFRAQLDLNLHLAERVGQLEQARTHEEPK